MSAFGYGGRHLLGVLLELFGVLLIFCSMPLQVFVIVLGAALTAAGLVLLR